MRQNRRDSGAVRLPAEMRYFERSARMMEGVELTDLLSEPGTALTHHLEDAFDAGLTPGCAIDAYNLGCTPAEYKASETETI